MESEHPDQAKRVIADTFTRASATYGQVGPGYFSYFGQHLVAHAQLEPGMRVLDVATGRGAVLFPAAQAVGPTGSITGIDLSEGMVSATTAELEQRGITNATVEVMDAEHLAFPDATFDAITCGFALFFMPDRTSALREFRRVLRPGGRLAISTWGSEDPPAEKLRWEWYERLIKRFLPEAAHAASMRVMDAPEQIIERFTQAGFVDIALQSETTTFTYASPEEWWQERWSVFFRQSLENLSSEDRAALEADALAHAREMAARHELITEMTVFFTVANNPAG